MPANRPETFGGMVSRARPAPTAGGGHFGGNGGMVVRPMAQNIPKTLDFSVGAGHARETHRPIVLSASRAACPRRSGGPITLPPGAHDAPDDHHGRSRFGKCSHIFRKTGKKSGMVIFSSMIPVGCALLPWAGQRPRHIGRPPRPRPNLPKEQEIFSNGDQPGPTGVPDFGKTENRNQGR